MNMTRRTALRNIAIAGAAVSVAPAYLSRAQASALAEGGGGYPYRLPDLPYAVDALEPAVDAMTMQIHHGKHHAGYVKKLNAALADFPEHAERPLEELLQDLPSLPEAIREKVRNHGGGHWNHSLFWTSLSPVSFELRGRLAAAVETSFGGSDSLVEKLKSSGLQVFGSGWVWLTVKDGGELVIETTANQDTPLMHGHRPLLGMDVWEHAYYLHYQNRRAEYLEAVLRQIHWPAVNQRYLRTLGVEG